MQLKSIIKLLTGPLMGLLMYSLLLFYFKTKPTIASMGFITAWMAFWWLTEAVHLAVTSFLPFILMPAFRILDAKETAYQYMDQIIFLFIGGFILAFAIEKWGLHKRFARFILSLTGLNPPSILLGIMLTSFFISMWISNTATVMMLLSAVLSITGKLNHVKISDSEKISESLFIGLAYSATIGGMATLVGTPTNMIFYSYYQQLFPANQSVSFFSWFIVGFPIALLLLFVCYFILLKKFELKKIQTENYQNITAINFDVSGKMSFEEKAISIVFGITVLLWFFRTDIPIGSIVIPGWSHFFSFASFIQDSSIAILMATVLFFIPSKKVKGEALLCWDDIKRLPFDVILIFGSGFALSKGFEISGLSKWISLQLSSFSGLHLWLIVISLCFIITLLSEFSSNVASIQLMLPVILPMSQALHINPLILMVPATLAASLGFMLPVATAPNTIVYGTGKIKVKNMYQTGFILNVCGVFIIAFVVLTLGKFIFKF